MLDTSICVDLMRGRGAALFKRLEHCKIGEAGISVITLAELEHGVEKSAKPEQNRTMLYTFCSPLEIVPFDHEAAVAYGAIRAELERSGRIIGPMDMLIAAHALAEGATLVTNNEREFQRVVGLAIENWT